MEVRNPAFFQTPSFWVTEYGEVLEALRARPKGSCETAGTSAGGREIGCIAYGEFEEVKRTATFSSAIGAGYPPAFFGETRRRKPVLAIVSSIHGSEVEGCATLMNFIHVIETGRDLRGRPWSNLQRLASQMRIVMVPLAQPDGRVRCGITNLVGGDIDDVYYYGQGLTRAGEILRWPECKRRHPVAAEEMAFLGGYYNDDGVNIQHEDFFSPTLAPETRSLLDLVRREVPDCVLSLHSCGAGPFFIAPDNLIAQSYQYLQLQLATIVAARHRMAGLRPNDSPRTGPVGGFHFQTAVHYASGALPLLFEFPHGLRGKPYTLDEILDTGLTMLEEVLGFGTAWGYLPPEMR